MNADEEVIFPRPRDSSAKLVQLSCCKLMLGGGGGGPLNVGGQKGVFPRWGG